MKQIAISKNFKHRAFKAILSIILFIATYLFLIACALGLMVACGYGAVMLIALRPSLITLMLGIAIFSIGVLILFFMVKFVFASNKTDRSNLIEIYQRDEPRLFEFINTIVKETGTDFPKRIYISSEVNASVFYDSNFWSMFLPVKKNLHIGLGLMNSVTTDEFKGIIAHEFGHFSQRSMKVGSYVYNVNQVIHNMLYDNESYEAIISKWSNLSGYFSFATAIGIKIIGGVQWVLKQVYNVVNINYMALSREMEFHADEVAANIAGSQSLATSLVRMELAAQAYNNVLNFYGNKIQENLRPSDIFPQQQFLMAFSAEEHKLPMANDLPVVTLETKNRFNKSKLSFDDQWSSHPSDHDRIKRLNELNIIITETDTSIAINLFADKEEIQALTTINLFASVNYTGETHIHNFPDFKKEYLESYTKTSFSKKYNNYYDDLPIGSFDFENTEISKNNTTEEELFSLDSVNKVYYSIGLENDLNILKRISAGEFKLKSFDYDGQRFTPKDTNYLISKIESEIKAVKLDIAENDKNIFDYYYAIAQSTVKAAEYKAKYFLYQNQNLQMEKDIKLVNEMYAITAFTQEVTPFEKIGQKMNEVYDKEDELKVCIKDVLDNKNYENVLTDESREIFNRYISAKHTYFQHERYDDEAMELLFRSINTYNLTSVGLLFNLKKDFLDFQAGLNTTFSNLHSDASNESFQHLN